jgi:acetylornithine/succinyldiaminopimelate/putrescine aminotransferase
MVRGFQYVPYNDLEALEKMVKDMNSTPVIDAIQGR